MSCMCCSALEGALPLPCRLIELFEELGSEEEEIHGSKVGLYMTVGGGCGGAGELLEGPVSSSAESSGPTNGPAGSACMRCAAGENTDIGCGDVLGVQVSGVGAVVGRPGEAPTCMSPTAAPPERPAASLSAEASAAGFGTPCAMASSCSRRLARSAERASTYKRGTPARQRHL